MMEKKRTRRGRIDRVRTLRSQAAKPIAGVLAALKDPSGEADAAPHAATTSLRAAVGLQVPIGRQASPAKPLRRRRHRSAERYRCTRLQTFYEPRAMPIRLRMVVAEVDTDRSDKVRIRTTDVPVAKRRQDLDTQAASPLSLLVVDPSIGAAHTSIGSAAWGRSTKRKRFLHRISAIQAFLEAAK
jgi:hypothetical protein